MMFVYLYSQSQPGALAPGFRTPPSFLDRTIMDFTLRPAAPGDVDTILRCIQGLADFEHLRHECRASRELLLDSLFGEDPSAFVTLAFDGDIAAGFALWFRNYSTFLARPGIYLEDLFVFPEFRGRGLGRQLLASLAATAVSRGYGRLEWAVLDWNADAIRFYESVGARAKSEWTTYQLSGPALAELGSTPGDVLPAS